MSAKNPSLTTISNAAILLNDYYWALAGIYVKPLLKSLDNHDHNIHYYKIISMSELAVMAVLPFELTDTTSSVSKRSVNAEFAFFVAISIMLAWRVDGKPIIDNASLKQIYTYKEIIDIENGTQKLYPEDFRLSHVEWLRGLNPSAPLPIISNSETWRMLFIAAKLSAKQ